MRFSASMRQGGRRAVAGLLIALLLGGGALVAARPGDVARWAGIGQLNLVEAVVAPARPPRALPETAESFVDGIGVVVHLVYADSGYANWPQVLQALRYLGVTRLREVAPLPGNARIEHVHAAADAGYRFSFLVLGQVPLDDSVAALAAFSRRHPGAVAAIEGPNEVNNFPFPYRNLTGDAAAQAFQADLYARVRADPDLRGVPVYNLTSWPDLTGRADFANIHSYAHAGAQARATLLGDMARQQQRMPGKPVVLTEAGYHTTIGAGLWEGVDPATAAPLTLNLLFDAWAAGVSQTYLYQLLDGYPDPGGKEMERHFGLFDVDYRPKPAATAVRNLLRALRDTGARRPQLREADVRDAPGDLAVLQLARGDGARIVILYRRAALWDPAGDRPLPVAPVSVRIAAPRGAGAVTIDDPVAGSRRKATAAPLTLAIGADPQVLAFR